MAYGSDEPSAGASWRAAMHEASPYLGLGMQIALSMAFFVGGGYLLDRWLSTTPWLLVAGAVLGMIAIFVQIIRVSQELGAKSKAAAAARKRDEERSGSA